MVNPEQVATAATTFSFRAAAAVAGLPCSGLRGAVRTSTFSPASSCSLESDGESCLHR